MLRHHPPNEVMKIRHDECKMAETIAGARASPLCRQKTPWSGLSQINTTVDFSASFVSTDEENTRRGAPPDEIVSRSA
jgi:hypothetical protein